MNLPQKRGGSIVVEGFRSKSKEGIIKQAWPHPLSHEWIESRNEYICKYSWGSLSCKYVQKKDTLFLSFVVKNLTVSDTLMGISASLMAFNLKQRPLNFLPNNPYYRNNIDYPSIIQAELTDFNLILENPDVSNKMYIGLIEENGSDGKRFRVWVGNLPYHGMKNFNPVSSIRLAPGKSFSGTIAIKFSKPGTPFLKLTQTTLDKYREQHPFELNWIDKRSIGALFLSSYRKNETSVNKRNWVFSPNIGSSLNGIINEQTFTKNLNEYAAKCIMILKRMNSQGVIIWDIEGQEFPHPLSYVGSPEHLAMLSPEMDATADKFFLAFKKAGIRTGICIRPDSVVFAKDKNSIKHLFVSDPASTLIRKIRLAKKRWGCSLFYIDSNLKPDGQVMDASVFKKVAEACPDVLLIPEHQNPAYYSFSAPYEELRMGTLTIDESIKSLYPKATMVLSVPEGFPTNMPEAIQRERLKKSFDQGNIFLYRAWYWDPINKIIQETTKTNKN